MIALRRAITDDVEAIRAVVRAAYARWVPVMGREPVPMVFDYAKAIERHVIDLHHIGDDLAGLIEMHAAPDHLMIVNVAVAPLYQGRGIGRALMAHAERFTLEHGLTEVRLFTNKLMVDNQRLYERLGYRFEREEPFRGGAVVHMSKTLHLDQCAF